MRCMYVYVSILYVSRSSDFVRLSHTLASEEPNGRKEEKLRLIYSCQTWDVQNATDDDSGFKAKARTRNNRGVDRS